jgi:ABC-2 type transport system ATP-binding protein
VTLVEIDKIRKSYDSFVAVDDLSLAIPQGEVYGLLGPNGAGKTSTIRMIIGITLPDSGAVRMFGEPFHRGHLGRIGYLPEERGLYKKMKVIEQLVFLGEVHGLSARAAMQRSREWCERLDLADWADKKVEELSKGMQQKVQFIAAVLHDPEFIIMDEPFSGMDPVNTVKMKDLLLGMKQQGKTILFSTHRMDTVERLCDSICLIDHGRAVLHGELSEIRSRWGKNHVQIQYDGDGAFLLERRVVAGYNDYGNYVEVALAPGADPQELLKLAAARARISRFEVLEPSLEQIFIETVESPQKVVARA